MLAAVDVSSFTQKSRRGFHSRKPGKDKTNSCQCIRVEAAAYGLQIKHTDGQHVGWEVCEWWTLAVETQTGDLWVTRIIQKLCQHSDVMINIFHKESKFPMAEQNTHETTTPIVWTGHLINKTRRFFASAYVQTKSVTLIGPHDCGVKEE